MKNHLLFTWLAAAAFFICQPSMSHAQVPIDETHFPDSVFRKYVQDNFDTDGSGILSKEECEAVTSINVEGSSDEVSPLADLTGIEHFPGLFFLHCGYTSLTSLDVSHNPALIQFDCSNTGLTSLDVSHNPALETLTCSNTGLTSLDVSHNPALRALSCSYTNLTNVDVSHNPALRSLFCSLPDLKSLDVSQNPALETLFCTYSTNLTDLDVSRNQALEGLYCALTGLTSLDVSQNPALKSLSCSHTNLTSLDVSRNPALERLECGNTDLASLDVSRNPALELLSCDYTDLTSLDVSHNPALIQFNCSYTGLTKLDVSKNPALESLSCNNTGLTKLDVSHNPALNTLYCGYTGLTKLDVSHNPALKTLYCVRTGLTSLDLSQNWEMEYLSWGSVRREVRAEVGGTYDLNRLPGFDVSRASDWKGGSVQGTVLTFNDKKVSYRYATFYPGESGKVADTLEFSLVADSTQIPIDQAHFPDSVFRKYVKDNSDTDGNGSLSVKEGEAVTLINVEGTPNEGSPLADLTGIEYFPSLETLRCPNTSLKSLDVSQNTALMELDCSKTEITSLDLSQNEALKRVLCHEMYLKSLDVSQNLALEMLVCYNTYIDTLDVSQNPALKVLGCASTNLTSLDVSRNPALEELSCSRTGIKTLDVSQNPALIYLDCAETGMTSLDVSHNPDLEELHCGSEGLKTLDVSRNTELTFLDCSHAGITKLDLTQNLKLKELWCSETSLTSLDISKNTELRKVLCPDSPLLGLDVSQNTLLKVLDCSGTALTSLDVSHNPELFFLDGSDIQRELKLAVGKTYDLSQFPGFDVSRASDWSGGSVEGTILTFNDAEVTYQYMTLYSGQNGGVPTTLEFKLVANPNLTLVAEPVFSPDGGSVVEKGDTIRLSCVTEGATIYYGLGGNAEPDQEYQAAEGIVISQDTTYLTAWAMLAGEDTSEVVRAVYYVKIDEPEPDPDPEPEPDTVHVVLPSGLEAKVDGNSVSLGWNSEENHVYQLRVQGHGMQDTLSAEVESAGAYTEYRFTDLEKGTYSWAVRVIRVEETDTLSRFVAGDDFVIGEVSVDGELLSGIRLYPNPSSGSFQVEVGEAGRLDIFTAVGVRVLGRDLEPGTETVELSASGLYLLRFTTTDGRVAYRRMVVR